MNTCMHIIKSPHPRMRVWVCDICYEFIEPVSVRDLLPPLNKDQIEFKNKLMRQRRVGRLYY